MGRIYVLHFTTHIPYSLKKEGPIRDSAVISAGAYGRRTLSTVQLAFWSLVLANAFSTLKVTLERHKYLTSGKE